MASTAVKRAAGVGGGLSRPQKAVAMRYTGRKKNRKEKNTAGALWLPLVTTARHECWMEPMTGLKHRSGHHHLLHPSLLHLPSTNISPHFAPPCPPPHPPVSFSHVLALLLPLHSPPPTHFFLFLIFPFFYIILLLLLLTLHSPSYPTPPLPPISQSSLLPPIPPFSIGSAFGARVSMATNWRRAGRHVTLFQLDGRAH